MHLAIFYYYITYLLEKFCTKDILLIFSVHEYNYLVPFFDPNQFRIPRMSSEFGLQSFPSYETLEPVYDADDMDYWSDLNDYRNHHPFGKY